MKTAGPIFMIFVVLTIASNVRASGPVGVYAVLEKVVFEPSEQRAERIQIWGAFSFVDGGIQSGGAATTPQRGYLYFAMPSFATAEQVDVIKKEWADLKAMSGIGQAVAFGKWLYIGGFSVAETNQVYVSVPVEGGMRGIQLHVLTATPPTRDPVPYVTDTGIVKLSAEGSHAAVVRQLKESLRR